MVNSPDMTMNSKELLGWRWMNIDDGGSWHSTANAGDQSSPGLIAIFCATCKETPSDVPRRVTDHDGNATPLPKVAVGDEKSQDNFDRPRSSCERRVPVVTLWQTSVAAWKSTVYHGLPIKTDGELMVDTTSGHTLSVRSYHHWMCAVINDVPV